MRMLGRLENKYASPLNEVWGHLRTLGRQVGPPLGHG